jgi:hypothetical protein
MAGVEGLEPPTPGFGDRCSSHLSYTPVRRSIKHLAEGRREQKWTIATGLPPATLFSFSCCRSESRFHQLRCLFVLIAEAMCIDAQGDRRRAVP